MRHCFSFVERQSAQKHAIVLGDVAHWSPEHVGKIEEQEQYQAVRVSRKKRGAAAWKSSGGSPLTGEAFDQPTYLVISPYAFTQLVSPQMLMRSGAPSTSSTNISPYTYTQATKSFRDAPGCFPRALITLCASTSDADRA